MECFIAIEKERVWSVLVVEYGIVWNVLVLVIEKGMVWSVTVIELYTKNIQFPSYSQA